MKWILIALLLILLLALIARVYKKQLTLTWNIAKWFIQANRSAASGIRDKRKMELQSDGKLVRCENCGVFVREDRAVIVDGESNYCSKLCVKKSIEN